MCKGTAEDGACPSAWPNAAPAADALQPPLRCGFRARLQAQRSATSKAVSWSKDRSHFSTFNGSLVGGGVHAYHHHYVVQ